MIEYGDRTRRLPAPPHIVWADLVAPRVEGTRAWLDLADDEVSPQVLESTAHGLVLWSSLWPHRPRDRIRLELSAQGTETALRFVLLAPAGDAPTDATTGRIRLRVNRLLWSDLRLSYGA